MFAGEEKLHRDEMPEERLPWTWKKRHFQYILKYSHLALKLLSQETSKGFFLSKMSQMQ